MEKVIPAEEARDIVYDEHPEWESEGSVQIVGTTRWCLVYSGVFLHKPSGEHYTTQYREGATESQDERAFEHVDEATFTRVVKKEVLREEWVAA